MFTVEMLLSHLSLFNRFAIIDGGVRYDYETFTLPPTQFKDRKVDRFYCENNSDENIFGLGICVIVLDKQGE